MSSSVVPVEFRRKPTRLNGSTDERRAIVPFSQFIVKIASRCNLSCDYCYMYEKFDQSWRQKPRLMSDQTVHVVASRIAEHVAAHSSTKRVNIALHGGEPLLAGPAYIERFAHIVRSYITDVPLEIVIQTNGVLLTKEIAQLCNRLDITVGISIDGNREAHDRHRLTRSGKSTHKQTETAIRMMMEPEFVSTFGGIIAVVDIKNNPDKFYDYILQLGVPFSLLLPDASWDDPPFDKELGAEPAPYGKWLIRVFDRWFDEPSGHTPMSTFDSLLAVLLGGHAMSEAFGLAPQTFVVVETNGDVVLHESLRSAYEGANLTHLNLVDNTFDEVLQLPSMAAVQGDEATLCNTCRGCPVVNVCGGSDIGSRYKGDSGFDNPSVYCDDLYEFISHVNGRVYESIERSRVDLLQGDGALLK